MVLPQTYLNTNIPGTTFIIPHQPYYSGCVVAIVNSGTISSGEGLAYYISHAIHGNVVGFYGTDGSFGMDGGVFKMPGGTELSFTAGASLNQNWQVQIDSNSSGIGGVLPTQVVPKTSENLINFFAGTDVELNYAEQVINQCNNAN